MPTTSCTTSRSPTSGLVIWRSCRYATRKVPASPPLRTRNSQGPRTMGTRWPLFSRAAVAQGMRAVLASPLPYNQDAVGVVAVLSDDPHPWSPEGELALLAFTDLAALLIASMMQGEQQSELAAQLQSAL